LRQRTAPRASNQALPDKGIYFLGGLTEATVRLPANSSSTAPSLRRLPRLNAMREQRVYAP